MTTIKSITPTTGETTGQTPVETDAPVLDLTRVEEFAGKVLQMIADASLALSVSIGHRTGLFDGLAGLPPSTSQEVADATGLQERYVREWLAAMLVGGIVEYDPTTGTWYLPPEHGAVLTRKAGKDNLAKLAQLVGLMAGVEQQVVTCFREGGGVPYSAYTEFHALMAEDSKDVAEALLVDEVVPLVVGLPDRLSHGVSVADVGCGSGHHVNVLASTYPASSFVGYDFSEEAVASARSTAEARGLTNVRFEMRDVTDLSQTGPFDLVTAFDAIHDQAHPAAVLAGIAGSLAPDGVFLMCDIRASSHPHENVGVPGAGFLYGISLMHCMTVSLSQEGGTGLGAVWGEQTAVRMLHEAGFAGVEVKCLDGDPINNYYVARRL
jgi:2-polyprenyl-3-methyl-5-hydroxy-6-metoxy-1,4-benzoquinol methylase